MNNEQAQMAFCKWAFNTGAQLCPDGKWRYESDMLQAAAMDEGEAWIDGTKGVPEYTDAEIFQHFITRKTPTHE